MKFKFLLSVLTFFLTNSAFSACPYEDNFHWVEAIVNTNGEPNKIWNYSLRFFENKGKCKAELKGEGNNLKMHILADVRAKGADIDIVYREKGKEAGIGSEGKKGDVLFKLSRLEPESDDLTFLLTWGKLKAQLPQNQDNYYFRQYPLIEFEVGERNEKGLPIILRALHDYTGLNIREGEAPEPENNDDYEELSKWFEKVKIAKQLQEGEEYSFLLKDHSLCVEEASEICWYPTFNEDGSLRIDPSTGFVPKR